MYQSKSLIQEIAVCKELTIAPLCAAPSILSVILFDIISVRIWLVKCAVIVYLLLLSLSLSLSFVYLFVNGVRIQLGGGAVIVCSSRFLCCFKWCANLACFHCVSSLLLSVSVLETNSVLHEAVSQLSLPTVEEFTVPESEIEGPSLNGQLMLPPDFHQSRQYPVLVYVYGGPYSQQVS